MLVQISPRGKTGWACLAARTPRPAAAERSAGAAAAAPALLRPAQLADMETVQPLIQRFAADNLMLPKSMADLENTFRDFIVAVDAEDGVIGCGALRVYHADLAEICSLAVDSKHQGGGIGRGLVWKLLDRARDLHVGTVFALTLKPGFFERLDFQVVPKEAFPPKVWADCLNCPKLNACDEIAVAIAV